MTPVVIDPEFRDYLSALRPEEYATLESSVLETGCEVPLIVWGDILVDGHNRYNICSKHDLPFEVEQKAFPDRAAVIDWMLVNQLGRRNLSPDDFRLFVGRLYNSRKNAQGGDHGNQHSPKDQNDPLPTTAEAIAEEHGTSQATVKRAGKQAEAIDTKAAPELKEAVRNHEVPVSVAADVATLPKSEQSEIVARGADEIRAAAKRLAEEKAIAKREENKQLAALKMQPSTNTYSTIVIDPPWEMKKIARDVRPNQVDFDYPTMNEPELVEFGSEFVTPAASDHCHMFMWTTHKHLPLALRLMDSWGWRYVMTMVWHKGGGFQPIGLPQYNCEFCLYGRLGSPEFADTKAFNACFEAPRREHSRKPDEFYDLIRRVTHEGRIDIFARESRDGFAQFGNESDKFTVAANG